MCRITVSHRSSEGGGNLFLEGTCQLPLDLSADSWKSSHSSTFFIISGAIPGGNEAGASSPSAPLLVWPWTAWSNRVQTDSEGAKACLNAVLVAGAVSAKNNNFNLNTLKSD